MNNETFFSGLNQKEFIELFNRKIYFGKYAGKRLIFLPYEYLSWMKKHGIGDEQMEKYVEFLYQAHIDGSIDILRDSFNKFRFSRLRKGV